MRQKPEDRSRYPDTPDGRYFVVRGRLWRRSNPAISEHERDRLVKELMSARRMVRDAEGERVATALARKRVDLAKIALGERGPVWWDDGAPDYNRHMAKNTPYADWFAALEMPAKQ
jgi:hypothetical protein